MNVLIKAKYIFFKFSSININSALFGISFIPKIILFLQNIFLFRPFQTAANQTNASDLNRGLSSNLFWLRRANHVKFKEEFVMCTVKQILVKEC